VSNILASFSLAATSLTMAFEEKFDIVGKYSFENWSAWSGSGTGILEFKLEFKSDGTYEYTGVTESVNKAGTWSVKGNEITMSYSMGLVNISEVFMASRPNNSHVTLTLKGSASASDILASFSLAATSLTMIVGERINIVGKYSFENYDGSATGYLEFKADGTYEYTDSTISSRSYSKTWSMFNTSLDRLILNGYYLDHLIVDDFIVSRPDDSHITLTVYFNDGSAIFVSFSVPYSGPLTMEKVQ
jgi:hypothetical protein